MKKELKLLQMRYCRKGVIQHHGDCRWWQCRICTCGLLHDLMMLGSPHQHFEAVHSQKSLQDQLCDSVFVIRSTK